MELRARTTIGGAICNQKGKDDEITSSRAALTKEVSVMDGTGGEKKDDATDGQSTDANTGAGKKQSDYKSSNAQSSASSSVENGKNKEKLPGSDISGYLPLRGDFEVLNTIAMPNWQ